MKELPNIAMADTFMAIFGFKRTKPTDRELGIEYKKREQELEDIERWLKDTRQEN